MTFDPSIDGRSLAGRGQRSRGEAAQSWQYVARVQFEKSGLIVTRRVKYQVGEAQIGVELDPFNVLVWIG